MTMSSLRANSRTVDFAGKKAGSLESKRVDKKMWAQPQGSRLADKRFPMKDWDKHFSSVGGKRSSIALEEGKSKELFNTKKLERKEVSYEMSQWNSRMADLHKKAGVQMDQRAQLVADQQLYSMMLQDTQRFRDMAEELSLRDLNRYQFRRNRTDEGVPVQKAGAGQ